MVADALSRRGPDSLNCLRQMASELATELTRSDIELVVGRLANIRVNFVGKDQRATDGRCTADGTERKSSGGDSW